MTNKKITELVQATQVNDNDDLVVVQSGETKRVSKQVLQDSLSVESGTTINLDTLGTMDNAQVSNFNTGNSSIFNLGGILGGTIGFDTSNPIRGKQSFLYTGNAIASNSNDDWVSRTLSIPSGYRGRLFEFSFQYINQLQSGNIKVYLLDQNDNILIEETLPNFVDSDYGTSKEFSRQININKNVTSVVWGFQVINGESSLQLKIDDVQLTPNVRSTLEQVFVQSDDSSIRFIKSDFIKSSNNILYFANPDLKIGSAISYVSNSTSGDKFIIEESGIYHISLYTDTGSGTIGISKNLSLSDLTLALTALSSSKVVAIGYDSTGQVLELSWSGYLSKGEVLYVHTGGSWSQNNNAYNSFNISKVGRADSFPALKDQKIEIPTSSLRFNDIAGRGTGVEATTVTFNDFAFLRGDALSYSSSNGTIITVKKSGILAVTADMRITVGAGQTAYITKNYTPDGLEPSNEEVLQSTNTDSTAAGVGLNWTGNVAAGDKIRIHCNTNPSSPNGAQNHLEVVFLETEVSVTVNNITPQYGDQNSIIRRRTATKSGDNIVYSDVMDNLGSAISYNSSNGEITINEDGIYHINASAQPNTTAYGLLLKKNSTSTSIPDDDTLDYESQNNAGFMMSISWSGQLNKGDVVRVMSTSGLSSPQGFITMSKEAKPSVIGIDGRPVDAYQQEKDSFIRLTGFVNGNTIVEFTNVDKLEGNAISYSSGVITVKEDGVYFFSGTLFPEITPISVAALVNDTVYDNNPSNNSNIIWLHTMVGGSNQYHEFSFSANLEKGDEVRIIFAAAVNSSSSTRDFLEVKKLGLLKRAIPLIDSKVDIPVSEIRFEATSGRGVSPEARTVQFSNLAKISGDNLSFDNSNGTVIKILKDGLVTFSVSLYNGTANQSTASLTLNATDRDSGPTGSETLAHGQIGNASGASQIQNLSWTGKLKAGDLLRVDWGVDPSAVSTNSLNVSHHELEIAVALSNVKPQFEDVDSYIEVSGANGWGSTNTLTRRFSNLDQIRGGDIEYIDSPTLGGQFVVKKSGIYHISYSEFTTVSDNNAIIRIYVNGVQKREMGDVSSAGVPNRRPFVAWSGWVNAGEAIEGRVSNFPDFDGTSSSMSIAYQGKPSIASADITPFVKVPQFNSTEWIPYTPSIGGLTLGNGTVEAYWKRIGDSISIKVSIQLGTTSSMGTGLTVAYPNGLTKSSKTTSPIDNIGSAELIDVNVSANRQLGEVRAQVGDVQIYTEDSTAISSASPFTWTTSDSISFTTNLIAIEGWKEKDLELIANQDLSEIPKVWYEEISLAGSGSFTGGKISIKRVGDIVSLQVIETAVFNSSNDVASASSLIPIWARPNVNATNIFYESGNGVYRAIVTPTGILNFTYYNWAGSAFNKSSEAEGSIVYQVNDGQGTYSIADVVVQVPTAKFQTKYLSSNVTTDLTISDLSFNNITPGKVYRLSGQVVFGLTTGDNQIQLRLWNGLIGSSYVGIVRMGNRSGSEAIFGLTMNYVFTALSNTMQVDTNSFPASAVLYGDGTTANTFITLEQLDNYIETNEW